MIKMEKVSAVILAGGKNRRMGCDKTLLEYGGMTFFDRINTELEIFSEILISIDQTARYPALNGKIIIDKQTDCGPLSGLSKALDICSSDWLFVIAVDLPLFTRKLAELLYTKTNKEFDAVIPSTRDGRLHPLCAFYHKRNLPIIESQMEAGNYRVMDAITRMKVHEVKLGDTDLQDEILGNINTPEDYKNLKEKYEKH